MITFHGEEGRTDNHTSDTLSRWSHGGNGTSVRQKAGTKCLPFEKVLVLLWVVLVLQHESEFERDPILGDFAVLDADLLVLDPGRAYVFKSLAGAGDTFIDGVVEAFVRRGDDFGNFGYGHDDWVWIWV